MKLTAVRASMLLVFPFLLLSLGSCELVEEKYSTQKNIQSNAVVQPPQAIASPNAAIVQPTPPSIASPNAAIVQPTPPSIASPNTTANTQINGMFQQNPQAPPSALANTHPNIQTITASYTAANAAETYYQQLLAQYGEDYQQCLEQVNLNLEELASGAANPAQSTAKQINVLIALDASGSMVGKVKGGTKIDVAKSAIARFVGELPKTTQVGLTVFGHQGSNKEVDKAVSCAGIDSIYPLAQLNELQWNQATDSFQATGYTPMAATLDRLNQNLSTYDSVRNQNIVYIVSDGTENCDGDPVTAARNLHQSNAKVIVNVIGLNVNKAARQQLKAVAAAGGGEYFSARNAAQLNEVLARAKNTSQTNQETAVNSVNQSEVATLPINSSHLFACITLKMNQELGKIITQTNRLEAITDPNSQYNNYVLNRLRERQDKITAWRNQLQIQSGDRNNVTQLKQQLAIVTQQ